MNLQEQLRAFQQKRADAVERQTQIMTVAAEEGRSLDEEESSEFDGITKEIGHVESHVKRLELLLDGEKQTLKQVDKASGPTIMVRKSDPEDIFPGQSFVRRIIARTVAQLSDGEVTAAQVAQHRWGKSHPTLVNVIKAGISGGSAYGETSDSWGMALVSADNRYRGDFLEYLTASTVFDQLPLREVPANVLIKSQEGIGTGYWVGEKQGIPMSAQDFADVELRHLKVAALSVVSSEWLKFSDPAGEMLLRDGLVNASRERTDTTFISTAAAVPGVSPAGILASPLVGLTSSGTTDDALRADIQRLMAPFIAARNATGLQFVMNPALALQVAMSHNALGQPSFPDLNEEGGTLLKKRVVTGDFVNAAHLILLKPSDIWRIGATGVEVSLSRDATVEMDDEPTGEGSGPTAMSAHPVSMFQTEQVAFKVVRPINFAKRRAHAVQYISDADYGAITSGE